MKTPGCIPEPLTVERDISDFYEEVWAVMDGNGNPVVGDLHKLDAVALSLCYRALHVVVGLSAKSIRDDAAVMAQLVQIAEKLCTDFEEQIGTSLLNALHQHGVAQDMRTIRTCQMQIAVLEGRWP